MKHFVLAPDSFKGTMDAAEICSIWEDAIRTHLPDARVARFPLADGGEGMVDSFLRICGGERVEATVSGPFGEPLRAAYGILPGGTAVLEMAACAGLPLVEGRKDPLRTSTRGVGELLLDAHKRGVREVILGLGGSCTNDCGIGMAAALGYRFLNAAEDELPPLALHMGEIARILPPESLPQLSVTAACDVDNPLYGPTGATYTFGMQKGAAGEALALLDAGLERMAATMQADLGADVAQTPGAGAAGGLGAGVLAFLGGSLRPGIELLLDTAEFDSALTGADMVFTGEGRMDWQTAHGKAPVGVSRRARAKGIPCIALCGSIGQGADAVFAEGITAVFSAVSGPATFEEIKENCREDMRQLADSVLRALLAAPR